MSVSTRAQASRSVAVKAKLDYPVIDTDLHTIEYTPLLEDYIHKYGGSPLVDDFRKAVAKGISYLGREWYTQTPEQQRSKRTIRSPWWGLPAKNTLDLATVTLPKLLHERLAEQGTDFAVLYPNISLFPLHSNREDLRRGLTRAINHYHADLYRPYADRLTPVAAIPLHTPQEGIEELEFAIRELGLKRRSSRAPSAARSRRSRPSIRRSTTPTWRAMRSGSICTPWTASTTTIRSGPRPSSSARR